MKLIVKPTVSIDQTQFKKFIFDFHIKMLKVTNYIFTYKKNWGITNSIKSLYLYIKTRFITFTKIQYT